MFLNAFRFNAPSDPRVITLVIDALRDTDYFVRQEAIASVITIGKPAAEALPLLREIRDAPVGGERDQGDAQQRRICDSEYFPQRRRIVD
jgi:HEAT repeat protein